MPQTKPKLGPGYYRVKQGYALHWLAKDQRVSVWAKQGAIVDLTSPFLYEYVQHTSQRRKVEPIETLPPDAKPIGADLAPGDIRERFLAYEEKRSAKAAVKAAPTDDLPSAAPVEPESAPEPEATYEPAEEPESEDAAPVEPAKGTAKKARGRRKAQPESKDPGEES